MPAWLNGALRAGLQFAWAWLVAAAAAKGLSLPEHEPVIVDTIASGAVLAAVVGIVQWAERRPDTNVVNRGLRRLARIAMAGLRPAAYPPPPAP